MKGKTIIVCNDSTSAEAKRFKGVSILAALISAPFAISHLFMIWMMKGYFVMWSKTGNQSVLVKTMSFLTGNNLRLILLIALVALIDLLLFFLMYYFSKKYWIGLLFAPIPIYMVISSFLLTLIYLPMFDVITLG